MDADLNKNRYERIKEIAAVLYAQNKEKGLKNDPHRDWLEAEAIYSDKLKYYSEWLPSRFVKKNNYKIVAVLGALIVLLVAWNVRVGQNAAEADKRPYVSVNIMNPMQISDAENRYVGNYFILKNNGKSPASNVHLNYYITANVDKTISKNPDSPKWFNESAEGVSSIGFITAGGMQKEPGFRPLSPLAEYYYFEAVVSYEGMMPNKRYWTHVKKIFRIDKKNGDLFLVFASEEWDRNRDFIVPRISAGKEVEGLLNKIRRQGSPNR